MKKINLLFAFFTCFIPLAAEKVEVIFSDNSSKIYDIDELRAFSNTFLNLLEGQSGQGIQIPLADIKSEIFNNLLELKFHCDVYYPDSSNPLIESGVISGYSEDLLIELANLANFLDSPILLKGLLSEINKRLIQNTAFKEYLQEKLSPDLLEFFYTYKAFFRGNFRPSAVSGSGNKIVLIGEESGLFIYDGDVNFIQSINDIRFNSVVISSDGSRILAMGEDNFVYILDGAGNIIKKIEYKNSIEDIYNPEIKISEDGNRIFIKKKNGFIYIFDKDGKVVNSIKDRPYDRMHINLDGSKIAAQCLYKGIYLFDGNGNSIDFIEYKDSSFEFITSGDFNRIALRGYDSFISIIDSSGKHIKTIKNTKFKNVKISSDGTRIVALGTDNFIYIFDSNGNFINSINDLIYSNFQISVDGDKIIALRKNSSDIYIFDTNGFFRSYIKIFGYGIFLNFSISNDAKKIIALRDYGIIELFCSLN